MVCFGRALGHLRLTEMFPRREDAQSHVVNNSENTSIGAHYCSKLGWNIGDSKDFNMKAQLTLMSHGVRVRI